MENNAFKNLVDGFALLALDFTVCFTFFIIYTLHLK